MDYRELHNNCVVCAACKHRDDGLIICGARHWDMVMHKVRESLPEKYHNSASYEQGFIDRYGNFLTREEAFDLAEHAGQIRVKTGNTRVKTLYSEDLY